MKYDEILSTYKVKRVIGNEDNLEEIKKEYDIVYEESYKGTYRAYYLLLENKTDLSNDDLVLVCCEGNRPCFGYEVNSNGFTVYLD